MTLVAIVVLLKALLFNWTAITAHGLADHILGQSDKIAANKVKPGRVGWSHILQHVFQYHVVMVTMLLIAVAVFNLPITVLGLAAAILFSAITHGFIDRRWPVKWLLQNTGSPNFAEMTTPLCGMYLADQELHKTALWISAILFAVL